ncbi:MAG TPA: serine hydrolase domain-containing protein [Bryobacteraceae bacterium]|nr:serine hydrolase domain-containing protein [Bryobacteraceae bacterium]
MTRREFGVGVAAAAAQIRRIFGAPAGRAGMDVILREGIARRKIPCVAAMVASADQILYAGAFGKRDAESGVDVTPDSIFAIASMTKAITSAAAMQLVERGKVTLEEPVFKHLPELAKLDVLEGFDEAGKPRLRPARKAVTLRHLLTHTSGFAYDTWDESMMKYNALHPLARGAVAPLTPLIFEPGTRWQYGTGLDWTGKLVEAVSGQTLEAYFQANILGPLGMKDTSFIVPEEKFHRLVSAYQRQSTGELKQNARSLPTRPSAFNGGGGLYSTAGDYIRFMQMILRKGRGNGNVRILEAKTVETMSSNQTGNIAAGRLKSYAPERSADVDFHPGFTDRYTYGFLLNPVAYEGGRSAGSLAWAGIYNTFYWIDPRKSICATILMQFLPFVDAEATGLLREFERAVYSAG